MNQRTITMTAEGLDSLRTGIITIRTKDSEGRSVVLFPQGAWSSDRSVPNLVLSAVLSFADMDLIESEPQGLVVADVTGTTDWAIRVDQPR